MASARDTTLAARLGDPERIERQLERIRQKHGGSRRLDQLTTRGVSMQRLLQDKRELARRLARELQEHTYAPSPVEPRTIVADKTRTIYRIDAVDLVVHGVVAELINEAVADRLSDRVYSYRPGRSSWDATRDVAAFVRRHAARLPVERRGLHVFRADVANFGPSIPNDDGSALWVRLREALQPGDGPADRWAWDLVRRVIRPDVREADGSIRPLAHGMPTGSPAGTAAQNWFLSPLDRELEPIEADPGGHGFFARYGDDMLLLHPNLSRVDAFRVRIEQWLAAHGLAIKPEKWTRLYFNGAGRTSPVEADLAGTTKITYLGVDIGFDGTVSLPKRKARALLVDLRARLRRSAKLVPQGDLETQGRALVRVVNAWVLADDVISGPYVDWVFHRLTDRKQLEQLDYEIARAVIAALVGHRNVRGFREVSWAQLRQWGLVSLVALRNRGKRGASTPEPTS